MMKNKKVLIPLLAGLVFLAVYVNVFRGDAKAKTTSTAKARNANALTRPAGPFYTVLARSSRGDFRSLAAAFPLSSASLGGRFGKESEQVQQTGQRQNRADDHNQPRPPSQQRHGQQHEPQCHG